MIIRKKYFKCNNCTGIKYLSEKDKEPKICPFCGMDDNGKRHFRKIKIFDSYE